MRSAAARARSSWPSRAPSTSSPAPARPRAPGPRLSRRSLPLRWPPMPHLARIEAASDRSNLVREALGWPAEAHAAQIRNAQRRPPLHRPPGRRRRAARRARLRRPGAGGGPAARRGRGQRARGRRLRARFGERRRLVEALTDDDDRVHEQRKDEHRGRVEAAGGDAGDLRRRQADQRRVAAPRLRCRARPWARS